MIAKKDNLSIIIFLIPLSFIVGIVLTELLVLFCILLFLINHKDKLTLFSHQIIFLILFSFYVSLNSFFQINGEYSENLKLSSLLHLRFVFFALSIAYLCSLYEKKKSHFFFYTFIFILSFLLIDAVFQFLNGSNVFGYKIIHGRVSSFFKDELILGSFLVRIIPIILWLIFILDIDFKKNFLLITLVLSLCIICIYVASGRTPFFLLLFSIFFIFFVFYDLRKILISSIMLSVLFIGSSSYLQFGDYDPANRMFKKTFNQIVSSSNNNLSNKKIISSKDNLKKLTIYSKDHEGHIKLALNLFNENKIFGIGPKGFRFYCRKVNYDPKVGICSTHPHNIVIQILTELGLIGLIFYSITAIFITGVLFRVSKIKKRTKEHLALQATILGIIINLFPLIPGGNFFNNWISIILYYNIGIFIYSYKKCTSN